LAVVFLLAAGNLQAKEDLGGLRDRAVRSAVWVSGDKHSGAGCVIDRDNRLLLTNYHVVEESETVRVAFPVYDGQGQLVTDRQYYWDNFGRLSVRGRVLKRDPARDLALIQVERLPRFALAMPLADNGPAEQERIYRVGSPGSAGAAWTVRSGKVKFVRAMRLRYPSGQEINAVVIGSDTVPVSGDSGGPVFNADGELIGLHMCGMSNDTLSGATELFEIREFLRGTELTDKMSRTRN
jgi:S1-C subfamily serine protease